MIKKIVAIVSIALVCNNTFAQSSFNTSIGKNEELIYTAAYSMSGLMTTFGQVNMTTSMINTGKSSYLKLKCTAYTYSKWDSFFKIRDSYEAYVDPKNLKPYLYKRDISEGGYIKKEKYVYNYKSSTIKATMQKKAAPNEKNLKMVTGTFDIVSTLYHIRNMDIHKAPKGTKEKVNFLFDRESKSAYLTLLGTETISNKALGGSVSCYKIAISNKNLSGSNKNIIYLTADQNKIPVLIKFNIPAGTGQLILNKVSGLKN